MFQSINNNRILLVFVIPFLLGCTSVLSFQPFNFTLINFVIFPIIFHILCEINKKSKSIYRKKPYLINLFFVGYIFGIGFFLSGTYWISNSLNYDENFKSLIPFTIILLPLLLGLFFGFATLTSGPFLKKNLYSLIFFCTIFSLFDYIRSKIFSGFPWNLWSYSWSWFTEILQILNPLGLFTFNLLSIILFSLPCVFFLKQTKYKLLILLSSFLLFFLNYIYGNYIINKNNLIIEKALSKNEHIDIKIVSPNFDMKYNLDGDEIDKRLKRLIKLSDPDLNKKTIFIWPEGVLSGKFYSDFLDYKSLFKKSFSKNHLVVLGTNTVDQNNKIYNSFLVINNKIDKLFQYNKIKLVPFGEFLPMQEIFENYGLKKITEGMGSFSSGKINKLYNYKDLSILPLICYEIIFPELIQKSNFNNLIINISEDAWFGDTIGPSQHFSKTIFRAIENDTYVIRSANKGVSAIINNKGQVIKTLKSNESGNLEYKLPIIQKKTGYRNDLIFFSLLFTNIFIFIYYKKNEK